MFEIWKKRWYTPIQGFVLRRKYRFYRFIDRLDNSLPNEKWADYILLLVSIPCFLVIRLHYIFTGKV